MIDGKIIKAFIAALPDIDAFVRENADGSWTVDGTIDLAAALEAAFAASQDAPASAVPALSIDEVERIILETEPSALSDNSDKIWTRRMAVALAAKFNFLAPVQQATEGWVLVPREMTADMMGAYHHAKRVEKYLLAIWDAILAAAPTPKAEGEQQ